MQKLKWLWNRICDADMLWGWFAPSGLGAKLISGAFGLLNAGYAYWNENVPLSYSVIAFLVTVFFLLKIFGWLHSYRNERRLSKQTVITASSPYDNDGTNHLTPHSIEAKTYLKGQRLRFSDLATDGLRVARRTFEECVFEGPAVIWLLRCQTIDCSYEVLGSARSLVLQSATSMTPTGVYLLKDCIFTRCKFKNVGIAVPYGQQDAATRGLPSS